MGSSMATSDESRPSPRSVPQKGEFWWANAIFFVGVHIAACIGVYYRPAWTVPRATLLLGILTWQLACFAVTIGYHRLYSHRAFRAAFGVRLVLSLLGCMAFQGSIKWWCLRHRLHHRFTDDPVHDPYCATRGLFFAHVGWIFYKPKYEKMGTIDRDDLENDPVVRFQHKHYVPLALFAGFVLPTLLGLLWNDPIGAYIYAGLVSRIAIWHCTFLVNSLAHWEGLQPYTDENTSRGNLILALLTCGEGAHNFHAFPHDFRAGPARTNWDPSKWIIVLLHRLGLATGLRRARNEDVKAAEARMRLHGHHVPHISFWDYTSLQASSDESSTAASQSSMSSSSEDESEWDGPAWDESALRSYVAEKPGRCVVLLDGYAIDVTRYLGEHPGGAVFLRKYSVRERETDDSSNKPSSKKKNDEPSAKNLHDLARETSAAFHGGMNKHSRAARRRSRQLRVARVVLG
ncbi:hypothetical protein ACEPAI_213 [Sanghuangporus weigelae]